MEHAPTKDEMEATLARYRDLARQYTDSVSAANLRKATAKLEQQIRDLDKKPARAS
jgi:hypothetical protein